MVLGWIICRRTYTAQLCTSKEYGINEINAFAIANKDTTMLTFYTIIWPSWRRIVQWKFNVPYDLCLGDGITKPIPPIVISQVFQVDQNTTCLWNVTFILGRWLRSPAVVTPAKQESDLSYHIIYHIISSHIMSYHIILYTYISIKKIIRLNNRYCAMPQYLGINYHSGETDEANCSWIETARFIW